jgi:hypothetical protein
MLRWRPPKPNLMSPSIRGAIRVDHIRWITMRPVAPIASVWPAIICAPAIYCPELQPRRCFNRIVLGVRANGTRQIAARAVVRKWAFAGHRGSGYLTPSEMHARLKALLERMAKTCTRGSILYLLSPERFAAAVAE